MSDTPYSNKSKKGSHSATKKQKGKSGQERSTASHSALSHIPESEEDFQDEGLQEQETTHGGGSEEESGGQSQQKELASILNSIFDAISDLKEDVSGIRDRVDALESPRKNLYKSREFGMESPRKSNHAPNRRTTPPSISAMMARSSKKQDWRTIVKGNPDDKGDPSDSSSSEGEPESGEDTRKTRKSPPKAKAKDSDSESSEQPQKTKNPLGQLLSNLDDTAKSAARTVVNVTRVEKECTVRITDFSLAKVCRAMKSIIEFQERENTPVKMTRVLSEACKGHLNNKYSITSSDLLTMPLSSLFSIMAKETKVLSKVQFYNELKQALSFVSLMEWEKVGPSNHETYYFQQLNLAKDFMLVLRLMLEENKELCPKVEDKENGLIRLFKSFHSYSYWKYLWPTMSNHRYKTMKVFMDEYLEKALDQYTLSQSYKAMPYVNSKSADVEKKYYDKKRDIAKTVNNSYSRPRESFKGNSLSHMHANDSEDSDDSRDSTWKNATAVAAGPSGQDDADRDSEDSLSEASNDEAVLQEERDEDMLDSVLAAFNDHKPAVKADKKDYPCLRKILSGKCDYEGCPYGHRRETLLKGAQDMGAKLATFVKGQQAAGDSRGSTGGPYKVLNKEKYVKN